MSYLTVQLPSVISPTSISLILGHYLLPFLLLSYGDSGPFIIESSSSLLGFSMERDAMRRDDYWTILFAR